MTWKKACQYQNRTVVNPRYALPVARFLKTTPFPDIKCRALSQQGIVSQPFSYHNLPLRKWVGETKHNSKAIPINTAGGLLIPPDNLGEIIYKHTVIINQLFY